jgi:hypothetical protein
MQSVTFGIIEGAHSIHDWAFFQKTNLGNHLVKDTFLPYKLIGDIAYPMWPWFYSSFKGETYGL